MEGLGDGPDGLGGVHGLPFGTHVNGSVLPFLNLQQSSVAVLQG